MGKLAIFSDVHGNLTAFNAFLADTEAQGASDYLCLGDHGNFGPEPVACLDKLEALGCPVIMGNTDQRLLEPRSPSDFSELSEDDLHQLAIEAWCSEQLESKHQTFIHTFEPCIEFVFSGLKTVAYHGSPKSFNDLTPIRKRLDWIKEEG